MLFMVLLRKNAIFMQTEVLTVIKKAAHGVRRFLYDKMRYDYTLISTSTPLGSSSFIRASTVLAVEL